MPPRKYPSVCFTNWLLTNDKRIIAFEMQSGTNSIHLANHNAWISKTHRKVALNFFMNWLILFQKKCTENAYANVLLSPCKLIMYNTKPVCLVHRMLWCSSIKLGLAVIQTTKSKVSSFFFVKKMLMRIYWIGND